MAVKIFDVDPDAAPRGSQSDDVVGRFRSGAQLNGRPMALEAWRMTTGDPEVAEAIAEALGGEVGEWDTQGEEVLEVYTDAKELEVIFDDAGSIRSSMVLWGRNALLRSCDGVTQGHPNEGEDCACPSKVKDRKEAAQKGTGCEPSVQLYFRLADHPTLGKFKFFSGSWALLGEIGKSEDALAKIDGPAKAILRLDQVTTKAGRTFTKPTVKITGPVDAPGS